MSLFRPHAPALKQLPGVEVQRVGDNQYITSINGEKGYYIYEVDGKPPDIPINEYKPKKNITLQVKKTRSRQQKENRGKNLFQKQIRTHVVYSFTATMK